MYSLSWVMERFADQSYQPRRYDPQLLMLEQLRGDHNLNQQMHPRTQQDGRLRPASVLLLLVDHGDKLNVLFTQRTDHLNHHPGQISFPGGRAEPEDQDAVDTALRETEEEIGLPRERVEVIGHLDDYLTRTGFAVTPVVAVTRPPFILTPDPNEVADVFEVPLSFLLDQRNHRRDERPFEGHQRQFYAMRYERRYIWGATAGMLMNFYDFLINPESR